MNYKAGPLIKNGSTVERSGSAYTVQSAEKKWSFNQTPDLDRFEVWGGDTWLNESPANPSNRSELRRLGEIPYGVDVWLSYDLVIEEGDPFTGWALFGQFHATPDAGEPSLSPVWALEAGNGFIQVRTRSSVSDPTTVHETSAVHYSAPYTRGELVRLAFKLRFERGTPGHMQMWRDGTGVFNGPVMMGYNDASGPYFKYGVYRQKAEGITIATYSNMDIRTL